MANALGEVLEEAVGKAAAGERTEDGDNIGEDGLLVCGKCGTPKQRRIEVPFRDEPMVVPVMCACEERAAREREEREARGAASSTASWRSAIP